MAGGLEGEIERQLAYRLGEGGRQTTAGVVVPEQSLGDGDATGLARDAGVEHGGHVAVDVVDRCGFTNEQHSDHGLARFHQFAHKIILVAGQVETGAALRFTDGRIRITQEHDDGVHVLRFVHGCGDLRRFIARGWFGEQFRLWPAFVGHLATLDKDDLCARVFK